MIGSGRRSPLHRIRIYWNFWYDVFSDGRMDDKKATQGENDQFYHYGEFIDFCYLLYKGRYILRSTFFLKSFDFIWGKDCYKFDQKFIFS
jgi:hypothetical protein